MVFNNFLRCHNNFPFLRYQKKINRKGASFSEAPLLCVFFVYAIIISPKYGYAIFFGTIFFVLKHNVFGDIS
jgi:hypothetical protein